MPHLQCNAVLYKRERGRRRIGKGGRDAVREQEKDGEEEMEAEMTAGSWEII